MLDWRLCLCLAIALGLMPTHATGQQSELTFPPNFEHAYVSVYSQPMPDEYLTGVIRFPDEGKRLSAAEGVVKIPEDAWTGVEIEGGNGCTEFISLMPRSGVNRLELRQAKITTELIASIEKQQSLRELVLNECIFQSLEVTKLNGMQHLQKVTIEGEGADELWQQLKPWLLKCPSIQFFFSGFPTRPEDLRAFSKHRAPLYLQLKLDGRSSDVVDALEGLEGLVGLELEIANDVRQSDLERVFSLRNLESIVLNDGVLNAEVVRMLSRLERLKVLIVQGTTKADDFLAYGFPLKGLEAVAVNAQLNETDRRKFVDEFLKLESLRELPELTNATAAQLKILAKRNRYTSLRILGIDASATDSMIAEVLRQNTGLKELTLGKIQLTPELGAAIGGCKELESLELHVSQFDAGLIASKELSKLVRLRFSSVNPAKRLDALQDLPNLGVLRVAFETYDPSDCAVLPLIPDLESLTIESGCCDAATAVAVGKSVSLRRFECLQDCLFDDSSIEALLNNESLDDLRIAGVLSEPAILKLKQLPNLKTLSVRSNALDSDASKRLAQAFQPLKYFSCGDLQLTMGKIAIGKDRLERWVPDEGRKQFDELEGRTLASLLGERTFNDLRENVEGRCTLVEFWGTWCGPCMAYEPELQRLYTKYLPAGFQIVSVHAEQGHEQGIEYLKKHPKAWQSLIDDDGELADSFRVPSYPSLYLFDASGKLVVALPHRLVLDRTIARVLVKAAR